MNLRAFLSCTFLFLALCIHANATIWLPSYIGSHMVLQQQAKVTFSGQGVPLAAITLQASWDHKTYRSLADTEGNWQITFKTPQAGGSYQIQISDGTPFLLEDILIGEVWLCSGQSNMEMPLRGFEGQPIANAAEILKEADIANLRLLKIARTSSPLPNTDIDGHWEISNQQNAKEFSALAWQFGKMLHEQLKVPIGLILSSVGGAKIQSWMSAKSLQNFPDFPVPLSLEGIKEPHKEPAVLFNGMISALKNIPIKGLIWFQGESNRHEAAIYEELFPAMVKDWRIQWKFNFPVYYVQIAPFGSQDPTRDGPGLRQAQLNCLKKIPHSAMVSTLDLGEEQVIHFPNKTVLAERLSALALNQTYHYKEFEGRGPLLSSVKYDENKAILKFKFAFGGLKAKEGTLNNFEIIAANGQIYPAQAQIISRNRVLVFATELIHPKAIRYAYRNWVVGDLFNSEGLPAPSFKTK